MTAFFIYSPDGAPQEPTELEFAANLEVPQRQFQDRTSTGGGQAAFISELPAGRLRVSAKDWQSVKRDEEWPRATGDARMYVWWRYAGDGIPDVLHESADEVWTISADGAVNRERTAPDVRPRVRGQR